MNQTKCFFLSIILQVNLLFVISVLRLSNPYEIGQHAAPENATQKPVEAEQATVT